MNLTLTLSHAEFEGVQLQRHSPVCLYGVPTNNFTFLSLLISFHHYCLFLNFILFLPVSSPVLLFHSSFSLLLSPSLPCFLSLFTPYKQISLLRFYYIFFICFCFLTVFCCLFSSSFSFLSLVPCVFFFYSFRPSFLQLFLRSTYLTTLSFTRIHCGAVR
jgi:hypothetical protein